MKLRADLANQSIEGGRYTARCMCGWFSRYSNPYKASLGAKYHAELWCNLTHTPTGELKCYFCGDGFDSFARLSEHVSNECDKERKVSMNVGGYAGAAQADRLPLLDGKLFKKLQKGDTVTGKMIACREIKSPNFKGLAMDFKNGTTKFSFLARFDRFDIGALVLQCDSEETDDWIGQNVKFITKKANKGVFVNVLNPRSKPTTKRRRGRPPKD